MSRVVQVIFTVWALGSAATGSANSDVRANAAQARTPQTGNTLELVRSTIDAGGGTSTNGAGLVLHGTVGQPDAGEASAGELVLRAGYWRTRAMQPDAVFQNGFE